MTLLNSTLIRDRRHELGLAIGSVAAHTAIPIATLRASRRTATVAAIANLPIGLLTRLADHLGLPIHSLFTTEPAVDPFPIPQHPDHTATEADVPALTAVFLRAALTGQHADTLDVAEALGWTLTRLYHAVEVASPRLHPAGLRIRLDKSVIHLATGGDQASLKPATSSLGTEARRAHSTSTGSCTR